MIDEKKSGDEFDPAGTDVSVSEGRTFEEGHFAESNVDNGSNGSAASLEDNQEGSGEGSEVRSTEQPSPGAAPEGGHLDNLGEHGQANEQISSMAGEGVPVEVLEEAYGQFADQNAVNQEAEKNEELAKAIAERDEYLDALRRLQAEFENYRKRIIKQQTDSLERAAEDLVIKLLPVLDVLDLADAHLPKEDDSASSVSSTDAAAALRQVRRMLFDLLSREGLERVDTAGKSFDPVVHEAVAHEAKEGGTEGAEKQDLSVAEVMRAGYLWKGRLIRPAMVRVQG